MAPLWRRWKAIVMAIARLSEGGSTGLCEHITHRGGYGWCRRINGRTGRGSCCIEVALVIDDAVEAIGTHTSPGLRSTWGQVGIRYSWGHEVIAQHDQPDEYSTDSTKYNQQPWNDRRER